MLNRDKKDEVLTRHRSGGNESSPGLFAGQEPAEFGDESAICYECQLGLRATIGCSMGYTTNR